jgi:uncharacterized protein YjiS (DUF1127 family)
MLNLALALMLSPDPLKHDEMRAETEEGFLGKLALRVWTRGMAEIRCRRALRQLHRLDDRDLDDLNLARADLPAPGWRRATGAAPPARAHDGRHRTAVAEA